jgi:RHS repeat-associated protein
MMVAVNDGTGLQYLISTSSMRRLTNHLGSTVAVTNSSGTLTSQQRYPSTSSGRRLPFGGTRAIPNSPILGTDFGYTGQRLLDSGMGGIMDYKARFYSPALGRFIQPDNIIPNPWNPQNWNRFSYVTNNPLRYIDPTGHESVCSSSNADPECFAPDPWTPTISNYGVTVNGGTTDDHDQIEYELASMASVIADLVCMVQGDECSMMPDHMVFNSVVGDSTINILAGTSENNNVCIAYTTNVINCYGFANHGLAGESGLITHEYGHLLNYANPRIEAAIESSTIYTSTGEYVTGYRDGSYERTLRGYGNVMHPLTWLPGGVRGFEEFSDMWMNYVYDSFSEDKFGDARYGWMQNFMPLAVSWVIP